MRRIIATASLVICFLSATFPLHADDFANDLPDSTVIYLEIKPSSEWIKHPLREYLTATDAFRSIWKSPEVMKARGGITLAEIALGDKLENIVANMFHGGAILAIDSESKGAAVLGQAINEDWLKQYVAKLVEMARSEATKNGNKEGVKQKEYRGAVAYEVNEIILGVLKDRFVIANKPMLAKAIVDQILDKSPQNLSANPSFQQAVSHRKADPASVSWMFIDVKKIREAGVAKEILGGQAKDFGAELLIGGILSTLHHTNFVTGHLNASDRNVCLEFQSPHDPTWASDARAFFFESDNQASNNQLIDTTKSLGSISVYRDISQLWLHAGDLFDQQVNDQLAQADNTLTTLFSGRDFGQDILGALYPRLQIAAEPNIYPAQYPTPAIQLPAFALIGTLRDANTMRPQLKRIFQSLIGFLNVVGAMNGQPQLDQDIETVDDAQFIMASYAVDVDRKKSSGAPIQYNFSPCIAFQNETVIVSSTTSLAKDLLQRPRVSTDNENGVLVPALQNTFLSIDGPAVRKILELNKEQLIAQNMLEKGHSKKEAQSEIDMLLSIITLVEKASLAFDFHDQAIVRLQFDFHSK